MRIPWVIAVLANLVLSVHDRAEGLDGDAIVDKLLELVPTEV